MTEAKEPQGPHPNQIDSSKHQPESVNQQRSQHQQEQGPSQPAPTGPGPQKPAVKDGGFPVIPASQVKEENERKAKEHAREEEERRNKRPEEGPNPKPLNFEDKLKETIDHDKTVLELPEHDPVTMGEVLEDIVERNKTSFNGDDKRKLLRLIYLLRQFRKEDEKYYSLTNRDRDRGLPLGEQVRK